MSGRFLSARWIHLAMLNYAVDPQILTRFVPAGTELDTWNGHTFVSMVGFQFRQTRVLGLAIPFHTDFDEVNLRFYVRRREAGEVRRGVVFVKEIVPRRAIAWVARALYNENYVALPMRHEDSIEGAPPAAVSYAWRSGERWDRLAVRVAGVPRLPSAGSEEEFISEHYWGYARQRDGSTVEYRVEHPPWKVWRAEGAELDCDVSRLYGTEFDEPLSRPPSSAFLADGSEVAVQRGRPLD